MYYKNLRISSDIIIFGIINDKRRAVHKSTLFVKHTESGCFRQMFVKVNTPARP
ncbi:MAG: hypothetical protein LBC27_05375 [Spirochaetaceae bacterium]|nr:hypothetical protein [Spirochaetaceae bacterium]